MEKIYTLIQGDREDRVEFFKITGPTEFYFSFDEAIEGLRQLANKHLMRMGQNWGEDQEEFIAIESGDLDKGKFRIICKHKEWDDWRYSTHFWVESLTKGKSVEISEEDQKKREIENFKLLVNGTKNNAKDGFSIKVDKDYPMASVTYKKADPNQLVDRSSKVF